MNELEQAEKRIEKKWQDFELIKPHLFLLEKQSLDRYSPRVFEILQEFKSYIQQNENLSLKDNVDYYLELGSNNPISHYVVHDENGQLIHYWYTINKIMGNTEFKADRSGDQYVTTPYFLNYESVPPELGFRDNSEMLDWVKNHVTLTEIKLLFFTPDEPSSNLAKISVGFTLEPNLKKDYFYIGYDEKKGLNFKKRLGLENEKSISRFDVSKDSGIDRFAESILNFLKGKRYKSTDSLVSGEIAKNPSPKKRSLAKTKSLPEQNTVNLSNQIDLTMIGQWKMMENEEKERVLLEIERREAEDPNYRRPIWIPEDAFLPKGDFRRVQTERDQFINEDSFQNAIQRHFPTPRDNG